MSFLKFLTRLVKRFGLAKDYNVNYLILRHVQATLRSNSNYNLKTPSNRVKKVLAHFCEILVSPILRNIGCYVGTKLCALSSLNFYLHSTCLSVISLFVHHNPSVETSCRASKCTKFIKSRSLRPSH